MDKPSDVGSMLNLLLQQKPDGDLIAYQIGFDLYENASQSFISRVLTHLAPEAETAAAGPSSAVPADASQTASAPYVFSFFKQTS